jgi:hypothetical protein
VAGTSLAGSIAAVVLGSLWCVGQVPERIRMAPPTPTTNPSAVAVHTTTSEVESRVRLIGMASRL